MKFEFLMCSERSGSNLITRIIGAHSKFCGPSPTHMIRLFANNMSNYGDLGIKENWIVLLQDVTSYLECQLGEWQRKFLKVDLLDNCDASLGLKGIVQYVYGEEAACYGVDRVFVKENKLYEFIDFIDDSFPESKCIYLVRDPRDAILSAIKSPNLGVDLVSATENWKSEQEQFIKEFERLFLADRSILVRYEDLLETPEDTIREVCDFLGMGFEDEMLDFGTSENVKSNASRWPEWENLSKPLMRNNHGKFKRELNDCEIGFIESRCEYSMNYLAYSRMTKGEYPIVSTKFEKLRGDRMLGIERPVPTRDDNVRRRRIEIINRVLGRSL